ncbi:HAD-IA family hydrolase [Nocardia sp. 2]|uniref:HAD-IA family hydrolase n=1 Tax=Nocardia acididurans TaxID=2802282 RepID=A0ABS1MBS2_9NOCA|nr:HAD-IA family hydrolase [Nocardia acididurans]MBL1076628.1 HAD-IA family hydrolase [Nocardia acididurans]
MVTEAVLFDFSGTLFRLEESVFHAAGLCDSAGRAFDADEIAEITRRMTHPVGQLVEFDEAGKYAWDRRDLDPAYHRAAYLQVLHRSGVPEESARRMYQRVVDPLSWTPYPDTGNVLAALAERGVRVAIVSNTGFDPRHAFVSRGWDRYITHFTLSFEVGATKPDPRIFRSALEHLGVAPDRALMVGDSVEADGGALGLGCDFAHVEALPTRSRAAALSKAVHQRVLFDAAA